uniref:Shootin-1 n=1 Tax=Toxocara canis TaxID=6265 RepID=A0A183V0U1_TOXCA
LKRNTMQAFSSLCTLKQRLVMLETSDKDREQLEKINRDQATLIDEFRSQLKKSESERCKLHFDYEQLKITNSDLRRQLDDVLEASRKQKEAVQRGKECEQRYAETLAALNAEHEAREELIRKYSKMADYAEAYEVQVRKLETELEKLKESCSTNEANIALYTQHCPSVLKLMLEFADVVEKNATMNASQRRRLVRYTSNFELRQALMRKGRLRKPNTVSISTTGDSEDDEMAESLENMLSAENSKMEFDAQVTANSEEKEVREVDSRQESTSDATDMKQAQVMRKRNEKKSDVFENTTTKQPLRRSRRLMDAPLLEQTFAEHMARKLGHTESSSDFSDVRHKSIHGVKSKPLWLIQSEMIEKKKKEKEMRKKRSTDETERSMEDDGMISGGEELRETATIAEVPTSETETQNLELEISDSDVDEFECRCTSHLSMWRQFAVVEPLLEMPHRPEVSVELPDSSQIVASASPVPEQQLLSSPSKTLNDRLGLSLSPSVSLESVTSSNTPIASSRERIFSGNHSVDGTPSESDLNVGKPSGAQLALRTRAQSSSSEQPIVNPEVKRRARSISITVVSGRDYKRLASWEVPEGSRPPDNRRALVQNADVDNEGSQTTEQLTLSRELFFRSRKRLWSCEETRRSIRHERSLRRTISFMADSTEVPTLSVGIPRPTGLTKPEVSEPKPPSGSPTRKLKSTQLLLPSRSEASGNEHVPVSDLKQRELCSTTEELSQLSAKPMKSTTKEDAVCDVRALADLNLENERPLNISQEEPAVGTLVIPMGPAEPSEGVERAEEEIVVPDAVVEASMKNGEVETAAATKGVGESCLKVAEKSSELSAKIGEPAIQQPSSGGVDTKTLLQDINKSPALTRKARSQTRKGKLVENESGGDQLLGLRDSRKFLHEADDGVELLKSKKSSEPNQQEMIHFQPKQTLPLSRTRLSEDETSKRKIENHERHPELGIQSLHSGLEISESSSESSEAEKSLECREKQVVVRTKQTHSAKDSTRKNVQAIKLIEKKKREKKKKFVEAEQSVRKGAMSGKWNSQAHGCERKCKGFVEEEDKDHDNASAENAKDSRTSMQPEAAVVPVVGITATPEPVLAVDETAVEAVRSPKKVQNDDHAAVTGTGSDDEDTLCIVTEDNVNDSECARKTGMLLKSFFFFAFLFSYLMELLKRNGERVGSDVLPAVSDSESDEGGDVLRIVDNESNGKKPKRDIAQIDVKPTKREAPSVVSRSQGTLAPSTRTGSGEVLEKVRKFLPKFVLKSASQFQPIAARKRMRAVPENAEAKRSKLSKLDGQGNASRKRIGSAILLPQPITNSRRSFQMRGVSKTNTELAESAVMRLLDEAIASRSTLPVLVKKFCEAPINELDASRIVSCIIKLLNTMEVGNMWPSMLAASRHGVVEQVASIKERSLFELINQICAEPQWSDICERLFTKLATSLQRTEATSLSQHCRDLRCMLIAGRIAAEEGQRAKVCEVLCDTLQHLVLRNSSEYVVPMLCYALAITPGLIKEFLIGKDDSLLATRTVIAVHLGTREDYHSLFSKMLSLAYNVSEDEQQCLRRMDCDNFKEMFHIVEEMVVSTENNVDLKTYNVDGDFVRAICDCVAIYAAASIRLFPEKDVHIHQMTSAALRTMSEHRALAHQSIDLVSANIFVDITRRAVGTVTDAEAWRACNSLMLSCRLLLARVQQGSVEDEYVASFKYFRKQIRKLRALFDERISKVSVCLSTFRISSESLLHRPVGTVCLRCGLGS